MDEFEKILGNVTRNAGVAVTRYSELRGDEGGDTGSPFADLNTQYTSGTGASAKTSTSRVDEQAHRAESTCLDDDAMSIRAGSTIRWPANHAHNAMRNVNQSYGDLIDVPTREVSSDSLAIPQPRSTDSLATMTNMSIASGGAATGTFPSVGRRLAPARPGASGDSASSLKSSINGITVGSSTLNQNAPNVASSPATSPGRLSVAAPPPAANACPRCKLPATGDASFDFAGGRWHTACIVCEACSVSLNGIPMYVQDGKLWCEKDYDARFGKRCAGCNEILRDVRFGGYERAHCEPL